MFIQLQDYFKNQIRSILNKSEKHVRHHSINVRFQDLFNADPDTTTQLIDQPEIMFPKGDNMLKTLLNEIEMGDNNSPIILRFAVFDLPNSADLHYQIFPLRLKRSYVQLSGIVIRVNKLRILEYKRDYTCSKCKAVTTVEASYSEHHAMHKPAKCPVQTCTGKKMQPEKMKQEYCIDYQEVKIQENIHAMNAGMLPNSIWITLQDNLVAKCNPGDAITVCGVMKKRRKPCAIGRRVVLQHVLQVKHLRLNKEHSASAVLTDENVTYFRNYWGQFQANELAGRNQIIKSFAPEIFGMDLLKLGTLLVLIGGNPVSHSSDGTASTTRSKPHLLLVGEPGSGKSQILRYASKVIPRAVTTTGITSTSAGLTVAAVMDNGEWSFQPGALVLADGSICCIDEFNSMKEQQHSSIREAMENQTISVAKAGMVQSFNTRCSILGAANAKGSLSKGLPLSANVAMSSPMFSRFDLVLLLEDKVNEGWDERMCEHVLRQHQLAAAPWNLETILVYIIYAKSHRAVMSSEAAELLGLYFQYHRSRANRDMARTTVRFMNSLIRLSEAHARLMCHKTVEISDAIMVISLFESSMYTDEPDYINQHLFVLHSNFPDDSLQHFKDMTKVIFAKVGYYDKDE